MKNKCAVLLVRVSTQSQDYEPQVDDLKMYARNKGFNKFHIIETKETGLADLDKKVGANELFKFIQENPEYRVVFATEISRLARRQSILHILKEWFTKNKIQFYAKDTGYSLFDENGKISASGEIMFTLYGYFAESEMKQKIDRFRRNRKRLMEMGLSISGKTLFGYKKVKKEGEKSILVVDEKNAKIVRLIFDWYINGINRNKKSTSIKKIALECIKRGYPQYTHSKRNVNKLLKEEAYVGEKITNNKYKNPKYENGSNEEKYIVTNNKIKYPIIITREIYESVQQRLRENNTTAEKSRKHVTILAHILKCPKCHRNMNGNYRLTGGKEANSYRCTSRASASPCGNKQSIGMHMIDSAIWCLIKSDRELLKKTIDLYDPDKIIEELNLSITKLKEKETEIKNEIAQLESSMQNLGNTKNISLDKFLKHFSGRIKILDKQLGSIQNELSKTTIERTNYNDDYEEITKIFNQNIKKIENSKVLLKQYINAFVSEINPVVQNNRLSIFKLRFKLASRDRNEFIHQQSKDQAGYFNDTFVVLDKRSTLDIKAYKSNIPLYYKNDSITEDPDGKNKIKISGENLNSFIQAGILKEFKLIKLSI